MSQPAQALTDYIYFTINGDTSLTALTQGDEFAWAINCDTGSTIYGEIWYDINSNSIPEAGIDLQIDSYLATDGNTDPKIEDHDINPIPDGWYQTETFVLGIATGQYILTALDLADSTSTQRVLMVNAMLSPPNQFRGHVTVPDHPAPDPILENIWIETESDEGEDGAEDPGVYSALTDENGYFEINIGSIGTGSFFEIQPDNLAGYIRPNARDEIASGITENVNFAYEVPTDSVFGFLVDEDENIITGKIRIEALPWFTGSETKVTNSDPVDGRYVIYYSASDVGQWEIGTWDRELLPFYLLPKRFMFNYDAASSLEHDIICPRTDSYIYISVTENGDLPGNHYLIFGSSVMLNSETQGGSGKGANNILALPISSLDNSGWNVYVATWDNEYTIPNGFSIEEFNTWDLGPGTG